MRTENGIKLFHEFGIRQLRHLASPAGLTLVLLGQILLQTTNTWASGRESDEQGIKSVVNPEVATSVVVAGPEMTGSKDDGKASIHVAPAASINPSFSTQQCAKDADCLGSDLCSDGRCVPAQPSPCSKDTDCTETDVCNRGVCVAPDRTPVPTSTVVISTTPSGAAVLVDGNLIDSSPCRVSVVSGNHNVEMRIPGYATETRTIESSPGDEQTLNVKMQLTLEESQRRAAAEKAAKEHQHRAELMAHYNQELTIWNRDAEAVRVERQRKNYLGGAILAGGSALLVGAAALYVAGVTKGSHSHDLYEANEDPNLFAGYRNDIKNARTMLLVADILTAVGVPSVVVGSILLAKRPIIPDAPPKPQLDVAVTFVPLTGGGSIAATGHF